MPECNLWTWHRMPQQDLFQFVQKDINTRFRWDIKTARVLCPHFFDLSGDDRGWLTPIGFALPYKKQTLLARLLTNGVDLNAPCLGFYGKRPYTVRPIELLWCATAESKFLVLRQNPSIEFCVNDAGLSFCRWYERNPTYVTYISKKRMYALCFCLSSMGQSWPDMAWIMKDFLL